MSTTAQYAEFNEVHNLSDAELRKALQQGESLDRIWAAWELALRLGRAANSAIAEVAGAAPNPGVRSLLLVVLAGQGERDLLQSFLRHDPDDEVRAAAARHLAGTMPLGDAETLPLLLDSLGSDISWRVRAEILRLGCDGAIELPQDVAVTAASDEAAEVRRVGTDLLLAAGGARRSVSGTTGAAPRRGGR